MFDEKSEHNAFVVGWLPIEIKRLEVLLGERRRVLKIKQAVVSTRDQVLR
jgi:hypothetical protein